MKKGNFESFAGKRVLSREDLRKVKGGDDFGCPLTCSSGSCSVDNHCKCQGTNDFCDPPGPEEPGG